MRFVLCVFLSVSLAGCAARRSAESVPSAGQAVQSAASRGPGASLEEFMAKVRALSSAARPPASAPAPIEGYDRELSALLSRAAAQPGAPET